MDPVVDLTDSSPSSFGFCMNRGGSEDDEYGVCQSDSEGRQLTQSNGCYGSIEFNEDEHSYGSSKVHCEDETVSTRDLSFSTIDDGVESQELEGVKKLREEVNRHHNGVETEAAASVYGIELSDAEPVDFENNLLLWFPPEPEDEEEDIEAVLFDDDDMDATGEWGESETPVPNGFQVTGESVTENNSTVNGLPATVEDHIVANGFDHLEASDGVAKTDDARSDCNVISVNQIVIKESLSLERDSSNDHEEPGSSKQGFSSSPSDQESILVSFSTRCVWKGTVCEPYHLFRINYYGDFDKPLGRYLRDHVFDQSYRCRSCEMPAEAHVHCYTHRQGNLTISVKKLSEILLPGEREGKIWMWHRCLRCPWTNGFPPATRRIVMSDAAWGLSFGIFLELSFPEHAAANRVASCGHSLPKDCLRYYGFGRMVARFQYASIDVHSVYLPPSKLDFNYDTQDWIQKEANEVVDKAELLFSEVLNALFQILEKRSMGSNDTSAKYAESRRRFAELESMLHKEKAEFEESLYKALNCDVKKGQPIIDIYEIHRLQRQLLLLSYVWNRRLICVASVDESILQEDLSSPISKFTEKPPRFIEKFVETTPIPMQDNFFTRDVSFVEIKSCENLNEVGETGDRYHQLGIGYQVKDTDLEMNHGEEGQHVPSTSQILDDNSDLLESGVAVRRILSGVQCPVSWDLPYILDAAWIGEYDLGSLTAKGSKGMLAVTQSHEKLPIKAVDIMEDSMSWLRMPVLNFYHFFNKNTSEGTPKFGTLSEYNPVYMSLFQKLDYQGLLLPVGINGTVVPIYDNEPTSIISYALVSPDYHFQISADRQRPKDGMESVNSVPPHVRVSFSDSKAKYTVTCYFARQFEAVRKICCPFEVDYIRSLSRCKKWGAQGGKSNVYFAKSLDERFIIKQVTKTELESFDKFASEYFRYLSEAISTESPTCLAKILGIYQVTAKHLKGGKELKMDVLVMENLLFRRNLTRLYDLKGSLRSRYNPDSSGSNKVLLDQNLIEAMPTSPIFVGNEAKRLLERAVWNDTSFLASIDVMDYSLLVGVDEENHELVLGIIGYMRQYTWDKHLETWLKSWGGSRISSPTVICPKQYKKRFRKAMSAYFLTVPDLLDDNTKGDTVRTKLKGHKRYVI